MNKLRVFLFVAVFFGGCFTPACVYAQKRNPLKIWRQSKSAVSATNRKVLKQLNKRINKGVVYPRASKAASPTVSIPVSRAEPLPPLSSVARVSVPNSVPGVPVRFPGKQEVDAVIFDLDGTLLDSLSAWEHSGTNFLRTQGITPPEGLDEVLVKMSLMDGARLLKGMYDLPQTPEEILRLTLEPIRRRYFENIAAKPGVEETLRYLKKQGVKLCIATASDRELAEAALTRLGLLDTFEFIITCDEVGIGKKSPAVYEEALRRLGTDKARTLVAEDARYALETAQNAGFMTAGVADSHTPAPDARQMRETADFYVENFIDGIFKK